MNDTASQPPQRKGIELIPWSELTPGQKAGRGAVIVVVVIVVLAALRGVGGMFSSRRSAQGPSEPGQNEAVLSASDRNDGLQSLCRVFQIYGIPKSDSDADAAAKNAAELFKLAGNQSPARSAVILDQIAHEFSAKKLTAKDCAAAGQPVQAVSTDESSGPAPGVTTGSPGKTP
ncbi:MAG: hypothetical protein WBE78_17050 [Candidatus Binataceae bacterium]